MISRQRLRDAYLQACETELQAFKPGNVSIYSAAHDMTVDDFRVSAAVSVEALINPDYSLGERIYYAIKATREAVNCNTNLGIVLLAAPLMIAAEQASVSLSLRQALATVLANSSVDDAGLVFKAIALAAPAGLGASEQADVNHTAEVTLLQAMAIAADRDRIALQYTTTFKDLFEFSILEYNRAFVLSGNSGWAALAVFAALLSEYPDSHVERKYGKQYSEWIAGEMALLYQTMQTASQLEEILPMLYSMDKAFKTNKINPGTTADLTVATVLIVLLEQLFSASLA